MIRERRVPYSWLALGAVVFCAWCSMFSAIGGWLAGQDMARREASMELATAISGGATLPPLGVLVVRLDRSGPAYSAGVERNDVIVALNGIEVEDARELSVLLEEYEPGDVVRLSVLRETGREEVKVRVAPFPSNIDRAYLGIYFTARAEPPADL